MADEEILNEVTQEESIEAQPEVEEVADAIEQEEQE